MNQINLKNRLDVSNGTTKNEPNNAMQPASQTTENGQAEKKSPLNRIGPFAILAIGVDTAASFLKSKKAISSAAAAVLVRIRPEPPKKARLASPNGMAFILPETGPLPYYDKKSHYIVQAIQSIPFVVDLADTRENWILSERFNSEVFSPRFQRTVWSIWG